jgi:hypothetical protein
MNPGGLRKPRLTLRDQLVVVAREVGLRRAIYGRRVLLGSMSPEDAHRHIAEMEVVADTLRGLVEKEAGVVAPGSHL